MTQPIEITNIRTDRLVASHSRYLGQNVIYYGEQKIITFDTYLRKKYTPTGDEKVMVITKGIEYRPDLVAFEVYGSQNFWWKILEVNGIKDIWDFKRGKTIFLPSIF